MKQPIYLVCGVPGSGKTWVCSKLKDNFKYIPHDSYAVGGYAYALKKAASTSDKPILGEAPFRISVLIHELEDSGLDVRTYFILEHERVIKMRYESRENKPIPKQHLTRVKTVRDRSIDYGDYVGTSDEILALLKKVGKDSGPENTASV